MQTLALVESRAGGKRIQGFEAELYVCAVISNKAGVERARNFLGITHVGDLTAVRDAALCAKKGGELSGGTDAGVMSSHDPPKFTTVRRTCLVDLLLRREMSHLWSDGAATLCFKRGKDML